MPNRSLMLTALAVAALCCALFSGAGVRVAASGEEPARAASEEGGAKASAPMPFEPSEELVYEGEFSKLLLRKINIAEFKFTAGRAPADAQATGANANAVEPSAVPFLFKGEVNTRGWFQKLFGLNFHFLMESLVEPKSFNVLRTTKLDEQGKRVRTSEAVFDRTQNTITWTERDPVYPSIEPRFVRAPLAGASHDIITAIYFLRTQQLTPGRSFELAVSDSARVYRVPVKVYAEKKRMKSIVGRVPVVRVEVEMFGPGRLIPDDGRMSLWITDDARRLPVRARLNNNIGTIDITLKRINGGTRL